MDTHLASQWLEYMQWSRANSSSQKKHIDYDSLTKHGFPYVV